VSKFQFDLFAILDRLRVIACICLVHGLPCDRGSIDSLLQQDLRVALQKPVWPLMGVEIPFWNVKIIDRTSHQKLRPDIFLM
jgi:hypothetical protein